MSYFVLGQLINDAAMVTLSGTVVLCHAIREREREREREGRKRERDLKVFVYSSGTQTSMVFC